ncbi:MAG: WD40 repeat domain-containing protein [Ruminococcaceae bacterium]|nr:WD40 repeat domain-containing protein [Oscillospiraceae bacterium]
MAFFKKNKNFTDNSTVSNVELPVNKYYLFIAERLKICKYVTIVVLALFIVAMISVFKSEITVENFKYFMKYLDTSSGEYNGGYKDINYNDTAVLKTDIFKDEYVVVDEDSANLYTMYGINTYSANHNCDNPFLVCSDKYYLVYDLSGNNYSVYNAFSQLYTEELDYPISGAAMADNGMYAIVTKDAEFRSAIRLYDNNFKLVSRILKDKYVIDVEFSDDGSKLLIVSIYDSDGEWFTEIISMDPYSDKEGSKLTIEDKMGVTGNVYADGSFSVLCNSSILFFDTEGNQINEFSFGHDIPVTCSSSEDYTILVFNSNILGNESTVYIFDNVGTLRSTKIFNGKINGISVYGDMFYFLMHTELYSFDLANNIMRRAIIESGCRNVIPDQRYLLLVYSNRTVPFTVEELFSDEGG